MRLIAPALVGNEHARHYLRLLVDRDAASGSFLFAGPAGVGKYATAEAFARALQCERETERRPCGSCESCREWEKGTHPDALVVRRPEEGAQITLGQIRPASSGATPAGETIHRRLQLTPSLGTRQVVLIDGADALNDAAANALLKTLEEPRGDTVLVLTTDSLEALPQTIVSRCTVVHFQRVATAAIRAALKSRSLLTGELRELVANLADGRPGRAFELAAERSRLDDELERLTSLIHLLAEANSAPFRLTDTILPKDRARAKGLTEPILRSLTAILRDLLLLAAPAPELIRLKRFRPALAALARRVGTEQLRELASLLLTVPEQLDQNVSLRNALDRFTNQFSRHVQTA